MVKEGKPVEINLILLTFLFFLLVINFELAHGYKEVRYCPEDVRSPGPLRDCQWVIDRLPEGSMIVVNGSFTFETRNPLVISNKRNLTFNCNGSTLNCNGSSTCLLIQNSDLITVKNCTFLNFSGDGIVIKNSKNVSVWNSTLFLQDVTNWGIKIEGSNNTTVKLTNIFMNMSEEIGCADCIGIYIGGGSNNTLLEKIEITGEKNTSSTIGVSIDDFVGFTNIQEVEVCTNPGDEDSYDIFIGEGAANKVICSNVQCNKTNVNCCSRACIPTDECIGRRWYTITRPHQFCDYQTQLCVTNESPYGTYNKFVHYCKKVGGNYYIYNISVIKVSPGQPEQESVIQKVVNWFKQLLT